MAYKRARDLDTDELSSTAIRIANGLIRIRDLMNSFGENYQNWEKWIEENKDRITECYQQQVQEQPISSQAVSISEDTKFFLEVDRLLNSKEKKFIRETLQIGLKAITSIYVAASVGLYGMNSRRIRELKDISSDAIVIADTLEKARRIIWDMYRDVYNRESRD